MRWLSSQSTFKVGKRKTENVRWFFIRIFPFVKLEIGSGAYLQGAAGGGRRREAAGVGVPADSPSQTQINLAVEANNAFAARLEAIATGGVPSAIMH